MPHSEKQNHRSVKAAFLCLFSILDENKSISVSFDLPHFLTDTFRMLTSIWGWRVPRTPWGTTAMQVQPVAVKPSKDGVRPQPLSAFPLAALPSKTSPPVAV